MTSRGRAQPSRQFLTETGVVQWGSWVGAPPEAQSTCVWAMKGSIRPTHLFDYPVCTAAHQCHRETPYRQSVVFSSVELATRGMVAYAQSNPWDTTP